MGYARGFGSHERDHLYFVLREYTNFNIKIIA
jgi:hypothetical protein